jgi:beta-lactamase superfamily II metal-dependent hydrolase
MSYNGLEIDMLSLGDADSILVTLWTYDTPIRVLIDGGNNSSYEAVSTFLLNRQIGYIDQLVCSHPHEDHAGGLVELLKDKRFQFGKAWVHIPDNHGDLAQIQNSLYFYINRSIARSIHESLQTTNHLLVALGERDIPVDEPFAGSDIGFLKVCGPTVEFYAEQISSLLDERTIQEAVTSMQVRDFISETQPESEISKSLFVDPRASPLNDTSVILSTTFLDAKFLFTADAGAQALDLAKGQFALRDCYWVQIPHHGSRHNVTASLLEHFGPQIAYVSAEGNRKHPSRAIVNALKSKDCIVYSTHYPKSGHLWFHKGAVPDRPDHGTAVPLWDAT